MSAQSDSSAEWFQKANSDLFAAHTLASVEKDKQFSDLWSMVAFHAHQAAEKYLKGFLVAQRQSVRKTHDLSALLLACANFMPGLDLKEVDSESRLVNGFYISSRYPESVMPSEAEARRGIAFAEKIKQVVLANRNG